MEINKYAQIKPDGRMRMFVMLRQLTRHHNKSYDCENNNKIWQKPKISRKMREESVEAN